MSDSPNVSAPSASQVSIREMLLLVLLVALALGWWADHHRLRNDAENELYAKRKLIVELERLGAVGTSLARFPEVERLASKEREMSEPPWSLRSTAKMNTGSKYVGYYIETNPAEEHEGHPGFWVWTVNGEIVLVEPVVILD